MAYYLQVERYLSDFLLPASIITFDLEKAHSSSEVNGGNIPDFHYHDSGQWQGSIDILNRGQYLIQWQLTSITNQPLDGEIFQLRVLTNHPLQGWIWEPLAGISTHLYPNGARGYVILDHESSETLTIALWQTSTMEIHLIDLQDGESQLVKGRMLIYGLSSEDGDFSAIEERLALLRQCCELDLYELEKRVKCLIRENRFQDESLSDLEMGLQDFELEFDYFSKPSEIYQFTSSAASMADERLSSFVTRDVSYFDGMKTYCIRDGYIYHFYSGDKVATQKKLGSPAPVKNYLVGNSQFTAYDENGNPFNPFNNFKGSTMIAGWAFHLNGRTGVNYPNIVGVNAIYADKSGLFVMRWENSYDVGNLDFSFHLILAP